ncbi:hypothetical protein TFLX_00364 [Thermoflexales bacterium]|nr:hypothetical protein TFLX_00364 [Thermoflexales bacterium]
MKFFFAVVAIALIFGAMVGGAILWDGSYYLYKALDTGEPYAPHGRFINVPLQWPVIWASQVIGDVNVLKTLFGLMYALVPLGSLLIAWWIVRRSQPALFIWAALGVGFGTLMLQLTFIAEAILVLHLFWPVLLGLLVPPRRRVYLVMALLSGVILFSHPFAILLFAFAMLTAFLVGWRYPDRRPQLWVWVAAFGAMMVVVVLRFVTMSDTYESERLTLETLQNTFNTSLTGVRFVGVMSIYAAAVLIFLVPLVKRAQPWLAQRWHIQARSLSQVLYGLELLCILLAGLVLVIWGTYPRLWQTALTFRTWALFVSLPFMLGAVLESLIHRPGWLPEPESLWRHRRRTAQMIGAVFLLVLVTQSLSWTNLDYRIRQAVAANPGACVPQSSISQQSAASLLGHWTMTPYSILLQGMQPQKVILRNELCETYPFKADLPIAEWDRRNWNSGRFDMHVLNEKLAPEQRSAR